MTTEMMSKEIFTNLFKFKTKKACKSTNYVYTPLNILNLKSHIVFMRMCKSLIATVEFAYINQNHPDTSYQKHYHDFL